MMGHFLSWDGDLGHCVSCFFSIFLPISPPSLVVLHYSRGGGAIWIGGYLDQICDFGNFPRKGIL